MAGHQDSASFLSGQNTIFLANLFASYLKDPSSIDPSWALAFKALDDDALSILRDLKGASWTQNTTLPEIEGFDDESSESRRTLPLDDNLAISRQSALDSIRALMLIRAYRVRGHLGAQLDPLQLEKVQNHAELDPAAYGFEKEDFDRTIFLYGYLGRQSATLKEIWELLQRTYEGSIGIEFMHIQDPDQKTWLQERMEDPEQRYNFTRQEKSDILQSLIQAETFENFLHVKFPGAKRFGLEGAESTIAAMHQILTRAGQLGIHEVMLGMAHRGRINVLANVMDKPCHEIFSAFQGKVSKTQLQNSGDVKYHLGWSTDRIYGGQKMHLSLTANPSHLEAVNPVVLGKVRANQALYKDEARDQVMGLLLHGDAAMVGQGLVAEALILSELPGYRTGGIIHIIINNQIGFTTSPKHSRSSPYCSDVAKIIQAPILHVNGDDPEAVAYVSRLAVAFRHRFQKDVVIDIFCYRRNGHNEIDEPSFTQPLMYKAIAQQVPVLKIYTEKLVAEESLSRTECQQLLKDYEVLLQAEFEIIDLDKSEKSDGLGGAWAGFEKFDSHHNQIVETAVEIELLQTIGKALTHTPQGFAIHPRLERLLQEKNQKLESRENIDWSTAEALAFGSLLCEGYAVRLSGQDSGRGTFSQRHGVFVDQNTEAPYVALNHIQEGQAEIEVIDSPLSEASVMGFEYGYSLADPNTLVLWEGQFGDFANGAQVIIDQFLCSGEEKWLRMSGLVLLMPHGYEGQGPEHSSARLERYLQLCGEGNWQVVNCSTPANYFHVLRRQMHRNFRKPLVIMTPKSLLRHRLAVSSFQEMGPGSSFQPVIPESEDSIRTSKTIKRVILCSGKVYYDLLVERQKQGINNIAILRLEQFYPFPKDHLAIELAAYPNAEIIWCQEEPKNMGAWSFVDRRIEKVLVNIEHSLPRPFYIGRKAAASTATGYLHRHEAEQKQLIDQALSII
jgi:2-oxoglutarate dehydrogenase E1 component